jgi:hypothetical protein
VVVLDPSQYAHIHQARTELRKKQEQKSWLLSAQRAAEKQRAMLAGVEACLSELSNYKGYQEAVSNLLRAQTWDEFQDHWWMLKFASYLAERGLLREMEIPLPNGSVPDMKAEFLLEGQPVPFYVEAKSWRFHSSRGFDPSSDLPLDQRVERMKKKLLKQLPEDSFGVWAWDKIRDGVSGPGLGREAMGVVDDVCGALPQLAVVMVREPDNFIRAIPNPISKWPISNVGDLASILNTQ